MTTQTIDHVRLHIQRRDEGGETLWATPTAAPGIFALDNFPISDVDYTAGDLVTAADVDGALYVTGLAERRFQPMLLQYDDVLASEDARDKRRELRTYLENAGCRLEWLVVGVCGVAVPVRWSKDAFIEYLTGAPYGISECPEAA